MAPECTGQAGKTLIPVGDVFLNYAHNLFMRGYFTTKAFALCDRPRLTEDVWRMQQRLEAQLGIQPESTLCMHWRAEDFHHPHKLQKLRVNETAAGVASLAAEQALRIAKETSEKSILVLSNARFEAFNELMRIFRSRGLRAASPRTLQEQLFARLATCTARSLNGDVQEPVLCLAANILRSHRHDARRPESRVP